MDKIAIFKIEHIEPKGLILHDNNIHNGARPQNLKFSQPRNLLVDFDENNPCWGFCMLQICDTGIPANYNNVRM